MVNLDMTLREFFETADRMAAAAKTIRDAQMALGGQPMRMPTPAEMEGGKQFAKEGSNMVLDPSFRGVLRSTPQPSSAVIDPPEGLVSRGKTGVEIIAERQREEIRKRAEARGEVVELDPKLGLIDAEAQAVKARLKQQREQAERDALAKMTPDERAEFEGRA